MTGKQGVVVHSFLFYFALLIPISALHEFGHGVVCWMEGDTFRIGLTMRGMWLDCLADVDGNTFFLAIGGVFGLAGSLAIIVASRAVRSVALLTVGLAFSVDHGAKIFLEGFLTEFYFTSTSDIVVTAIQVGSLGGLLWWFIVRQAAVPKARS
ncbi:hypothetical protein [Nitrososphaera sp.]|uniref:hypothetical protein n=1 Tax=Nitrososphaera sp. TaxID=1971748 RepID=UPI0017B6C391|nr:hypothetical protein [Nitrososphaera sp.]NWG37824.1 hypothetical protein [Nitrososphaera sp.]